MGDGTPADEYAQALKQHRAEYDFVDDGSPDWREPPAPPPGFVVTAGGFEVPGDLDDDPALWTGEQMRPAFDPDYAAEVERYDGGAGR